MRVPRLDQSPIAPSAVPGARVPTDAPAAAFGVPGGGPDLSGLGRAVADIQQQEREKANRIAITDADTQLGKLEVDLSLRAQQRRGKDALGAWDSAQSDWQTGVSGIEAGLHTDEQRALFHERAQNRFDSLYRTVETHTATEIAQYDAQTNQDALKLAVTQAVQSYNDPQTITRSVADSKSLIRVYGRDHGWSPETIAEAQSEQTSAIHAGVITQMIAKGEDAAARDYYTKVKGELSASVLPQLTERVDVATTDGQASRMVDQVWASMGPKNLNDPARVSTMEQWIRDNVSDEHVRKASVAELRSRVAAFNAEQTETTAANKAALWGAYDKGTPLGAITRSPQYMALNGTERVSIKNAMRDLQAHGEARDDSEQMRHGYGRFLELSQPDMMAAMSENEIKAFRGEIGDALVKQLLTMKRSMTRSEGRQAATIDADLFNQVAASAGFRPFRPRLSDREKEQLGRLRNAVETEIARQQAATGKTLTRDQKAGVMQQIVDEKVMQDFTGFDRSVVAAAVRPNDLGEVYVPIAQVPSDYSNQAINWLRSQGVVVDADNAAALSRFRSRIEHAYAARIAGATERQIQNLLRGRDLNQ